MTSEPKDFSADFVVEAAPAGPAQLEARETDPHRLAQRQKQIDWGKNTLGYQRYRAAVPKHERSRRDAATPDIHQACSKRAFDGQIRKWRRALHSWDPLEEQGPPGAGEAAAAANPPAPGGEHGAPQQEGSYELVSRADAAEAAADAGGDARGAARRGGDGPGPKNARAARQAGASLPLKMPAAVGRGGHKRSREQAEQGGAHAWASQRRGGSKQPPTAAAAAARRPASLSIPAPSDPDMTQGTPELDWGDESEDDGEWQLVGRGDAGGAPGGYTVYNNWAAEEEGEEPDVAI
eukprot:scaffold1.g5719.t1